MREEMASYVTAAVAVCVWLIMIAVLVGAIVYQRWQLSRFRKVVVSIDPRLRLTIDPMARPVVSLKDLPRWHYFLIGMVFVLWLEDILTEPFSGRSIGQLTLLFWLVFQLGIGRIQRVRWMNIVSELLVDEHGIHHSKYSTRRNPTGLVPWSNIHRHWTGEHSLGFTAHRLDRPHSGSFVLGIPLYGVDDETKARLDDFFREHLGLGPRLMHHGPQAAAVA